MSRSPGRRSVVAFLLTAGCLASPGLFAAAEAPATSEAPVAAETPAAPDTPAAPSPLPAEAEATVAGRVVDARTGAVIAGAHVSCGSREATAGADGSFRLGLPRGRASLNVTAAGHVSKTVAVVAGERPAILVSLVPELRFQERMDIEASSQASTTAPAPLPVRPVQVLATAGAAENVFRVLQAMPGVSATNEFSSRLSVRGGGPDENLTVMDGIEISDPYRLFGLVSAFNPETVESFSLDTGAFGVAHGDRLSSLLVVQNRAGTDTKAIAGSAALSITDGNVIVEGKLPGAKGSWIVTGRRTYYDLVVDRLIDTQLPSFTDFQTKVAWAPSSGVRFSLFGLRSRESADASFTSDTTNDSGDFLSATKNDLVAATLEWRLGERGTSRTIASWYRNTSSFDVSAQFQDKSLRSNAPDDTGFGRQDLAFAYDLAVRDVAFREELVVRVSPHHLLQAGAETHRLTTSVSWRTTGGQNGDAANGSSVRGGAGLPTLLDSSVASGRSGAWLQDRVTLGSRLAVEAGVRFDHSEVNGRSDLSPRLAATLTLDSATRLRGAVGKYMQSPGYDKLVQSDYFVDLSHTGKLDLANERSLHGALALERDLGPGIEARAEAYYKTFRNLIVGRLESEAERAARVAQYDFPPELAQDVPTAPQITSTPVGDGRGFAYGFDLYVAKRPLSNDTRLAGWASYTYGVARRDTYGREYAFDYDRRHALSLVGTYRVLSWIDVATTLRVASGFPTTPVIGIRVAATADVMDQNGNGNTTELVPQRDPAGNLVYTPDRDGLANINSARLPLYARLDLRLSFRPGGRMSRWLIYLDVINLLNRKNVASLEKELAYDPASDRPMLVDRQGGSIPRFPSFGVRFSF